MYRFFMIVSIVLAGSAARAGNVCQQLDDSTAECLSDEELRIQLDSFEAQNPYAPLTADDFMAIVQEAREQGGTDTLLVDRRNQYHAAVLGRALGDARFELLQRSDVLMPPLQPLSPLARLPAPIRPVNRPKRVSALSNDVFEEGDNTDGQILYGPPGHAATYGCTGYGSVDSCKACCMATRTLGLAPIAAWAKWCHLTAGPNPWWHAACAVSEAAMLGALWYSVDKCNDNCERKYWNDQSVDWTRVEHSQLRQALESGEYDVCEGWVTRTQWGGLSWLALSGDYWDRENTYTCWIYADGNNDVVAQLYWGAGRQNVRVVGEWTWDMKPVDYRIVDIDVLEDGRQIPYVGTTSIDDGGVYLRLLRTDEKLYLDHSDILESMKVWVYGERKGNRLKVQRWNILWWSLLEGAL